MQAGFVQFVQCIPAKDVWGTAAEGLPDGWGGGVPWAFPMYTSGPHEMGGRVVHGQRGELRQPGGGPSPAWVGRVLGGLTR